MAVTKKPKPKKLFFGVDGSLQLESPNSAEDMLTQEVSAPTNLTLGEIKTFAEIPQKYYTECSKIDLSDELKDLLAKNKHLASLAANPPKPPGINVLNPEDEIQLLAKLVSQGVKDALEGIMPKLMNPPAIAKLASKAAGAVITIKNPDGTVQTLEEPYGDKDTLFSGPPCNIGVSSKLTIPLAPYSNAQVSVSLNIPCAHGEIDQVYTYATKWVNVRMAELKEQVEKAKGLTN